MNATKLPLILLLGLLPTGALAHGGHATDGFGAGFIHPFGGADHLLAMAALGLLAAQMGGRALWVLPLGFVAAMVLGGLLGAAGVPLPGVEPVILASVMVLGAMVAVAMRPGLPVLVGMAAIFGAAHGWAHGAEGPAGGLAAYAAGFAAATMLLHGAGILIGRAAPALALRGAGALAALSGITLAMAG